MRKSTLVAVPAVAVALAIATVAYQSNPPSDPALTDAGESERLARQEEALTQIEHVAADLQNQATTTAKILSQLNSRLTRIERANQEALEKLSRDIDSVASNQDRMVYSPEPSDDEVSTQESTIKELRARFEEELGKGPPKSRDDTILAKHQEMVNRFYEHGEYDEASRQREAKISESVSADFDAMDVLGVECRNAVCKVDYKPDLSGPDGEIAEFELINAITLGLGGQINIVSESFDDGTGSLFIEQSTDL